MKFNNILEAIGRTPLVRINRITKELPCNVYAKCEFMNPGGSVKDRIGYNMVVEAQKSGRIKPGDRILVSGTIGDHGLTILAQREGLRFSTPVVSDCAPLHEIGQALQPFGEQVHCMRDPTRGGLATVLNELAAQAGLGMYIDEEKIPVLNAVRGACEMLGMDPLYMANEGKMVIACAPQVSQQVLAALHKVPVGQNAADIGEVVGQPQGMVLIKTVLGSERILAALEGEHVPRIC